MKETMRKFAEKHIPMIPFYGITIGLIASIIFGCYTIMSEEPIDPNYGITVESVSANEFATSEVAEMLESRKYITYGIMLPNNEVMLLGGEYSRYLTPIEEVHHTDGHIFGGAYDVDNKPVEQGVLVYVALNDNGTPSDILDDTILGVVEDYYAIIDGIYDKLESELTDSLGNRYNVERVDYNHIHISEK